MFYYPRLLTHQNWLHSSVLYPHKCISEVEPQKFKPQYICCFIKVLHDLLFLVQQMKTTFPKECSTSSGLVLEGVLILNDMHFVVQQRNVRCHKVMQLSL